MKTYRVKYYPARGVVTAEHRHGQNAVFLSVRVKSLQGAILYLRTFNFWPCGEWRRYSNYREAEATHPRRLKARRNRK